MFVTLCRVTTKDDTSVDGTRCKNLKRKWAPHEVNWGKTRLLVSCILQNVTLSCTNRSLDLHEAGSGSCEKITISLVLHCFGQQTLRACLGVFGSKKDKSLLPQTTPRISDHV